MLCCAKQQTNYNYLWYHFGANYVILGLRGGDYRGTGGHTRPPTFWLGGRKGKCPPTDCPFSKIFRTLTPKCLLK